jgi:hypothetical protein
MSFMDITGSYAVLKRAKFPLCVAKAQEVRKQTIGWWIFKITRATGVEAFHQAWREALVEEVHFDDYGVVLGNYLYAQKDLNALLMFDEQSETIAVLSKVFKAAFPFDEPLSLPPLPPDRLLPYCREEFGEGNAPGLAKSLQAADAFYRRGLAAITPELLVVFIIR